MKIAPLVILFSLIYLPFATSQSQDTLKLVSDVMNRYENLLLNIYSIKKQGKSSVGEQVNALLCDRVYNPFPVLYKRGGRKESDCKSEETRYVIYTDCETPFYYRPVVEYLRSTFIRRDRTTTPDISEICVIRKNKQVYYVRYSSKGEVDNNSCQNGKGTRIAVVEIIGGRGFITELRFATLAEQSQPCLSTQPSPEPPFISDRFDNQDYDDEVEKLKNEIGELKKQSQILLKDLKNVQIKLSNSIKIIDSLEKVIIAREGVISDLEIQLANERINYAKLKDEYDQLIYEFQIYKSTVNKGIAISRTRLNDLNRDISGYGQKVVSTIKAYDKFDIANTNFLCLNYGLIQAPYNFQNQKGNILDPIKSSFRKDDFYRNFGISYLTPTVGVFANNIRIGSSKLPSTNYTTFEFDAAKEALFIKGVPFTEISYVKSDHNLKTTNIGVSLYVLEIFKMLNLKMTRMDTINLYINPKRTPQIPIINSIYLSAGVSWIYGNIWHYYEGDYGSFFSRDPEDHLYVLDPTFVHKTGGIVGLTYLKPYFQFEIGYNSLYSDFYVNLGANLPISRQSSKGNPKKQSSHEDKHIEKFMNEMKAIRDHLTELDEQLDKLIDN